MDYKDRKYKRCKNYLETFKHALTGIKTAVTEERNMRFHFVATIFVLFASFFFHVKAIEWIILLFCIFFVFVLEMINTAIERAVDVATEKFVIEAKKAKDVAAGAVLIGSLAASIIGLIIFIPYIIKMFF